MSIEDLIISKLVWIQELQSERQINDIQNLLENGSADLEYIRHWCQELDLNTYKLV